MKKYTFNRGYQGFTVKGLRVILPDQVYDNQKDYDGKTFPVAVFPVNWRWLVPRLRTRPARARLMGDLYGLHTTGTGVPVVKIV